MGIVLDIIVVVILLVYGIIGAFKGFFKSLTSLMGTWLALILTYLFRNNLLALDNNIGIQTIFISRFGTGASKIITLFAYGLIIYILLRIIALVLNNTVGKFFQGKMFGQLNRMFGFIFGIVKSSVVILALLFALSALMNINSVNDYINIKIEDSILVKPLTNYFRNNKIKTFSAFINN